MNDEKRCGTAPNSPQWDRTWGMNRQEYRDYLEGVLDWTRTQTDYAWPTMPIPEPSTLSA